MTICDTRASIIAFMLFARFSLSIGIPRVLLKLLDMADPGVSVVQFCGGGAGGPTRFFGAGLLTVFAPDASIYVPPTGTGVHFCQDISPLPRERSKFTELFFIAMLACTSDTAEWYEKNGSF